MASQQLQQIAESASSPGAKLSVAWGGYGASKVLPGGDAPSAFIEALHMIGIHSWSDFAGMMAGIVSTLIVIDWFWKKWKGRRGRK